MFLIGANKETIIGHPIFSRSLATFAEFIFYYYLWKWIGDKSIFPIIGLTFLGEILCWLHLLYQSELLGFIEDFTWCILFIYALYKSLKQNRIVGVILFLPYILYMLFYHLPVIYKRIKKPFFNKLGNLVITKIEKEIKRWQILSLFFKPILLFYFMNTL